MMVYECVRHNIYPSDVESRCVAFLHMLQSSACIFSLDASRETFLLDTSWHCSVAASAAGLLWWHATAVWTVGIAALPTFLLIRISSYCLLY